MKERLDTIGKAFRLPGDLIAWESVGNGNINKTYRVLYRLADGKERAYIFQAVNTFVFSSPTSVMDNIEQVTGHIRKKYGPDASLHFYHTRDGLNYFSDEGGFWRVTDFVDAVTFDLCTSLALAEATGEAFGAFQYQLSDIDASRLHETIPDFHNTRRRFDVLFDHVREDACGRVAGVQSEIAELSRMREAASDISVRTARGEFPIRVCHNDTKTNNVLFDRVTGRPRMVIDLDTVMPGTLLNDFGDAVRFLCNTVREDDPETSLVSFDTDKFRAFCRGYRHGAHGALTEKERAFLADAAFALTAELAARFLDDYLSGDVYFKILYPEHNLVRAQNQIALAKDIQKKSGLLRSIVQECFDSNYSENTEGE